MKSGDVPTRLNQLTMKEMQAIAFTSFKGIELKGQKANYVAELARLVNAQPTILNLPPPPATTPTLTDTPATTPALTPQPAATPALTTQP